MDLQHLTAPAVSGTTWFWALAAFGIAMVVVVVKQAGAMNAMHKRVQQAERMQALAPAPSYAADLPRQADLSARNGRRGGRKMAAAAIAGMLGFAFYESAHATPAAHPATPAPRPKAPATVQHPATRPAAPHQTVINHVVHWWPMTGTQTLWALIGLGVLTAAVLINRARNRQ